MIQRFARAAKTLMCERKGGVSATRERTMHEHDGGTTRFGGVARVRG